MLQAETLPEKYFAILTDELQMLVRSQFDI